MAKAIVKVDVRRRASLIAALTAEHEQRRVYGELSFSLCVNDDKRNIGYVILEWNSLSSLARFLDSDVAREMLTKWPVVEVIEVLKLRDVEKD